MTTQTITLSLPETTIQDVEAIAARRQISVASLLTETIEGLIAREHEGLDTDPQGLSQTKQPVDLDSGAQRPAPREPLFERYTICGLKIRVPEKFAREQGA
jgi:hypothetical protein